MRAGTFANRGGWAVAGAIKQALVAALVAAALFGVMIGLRTEQGPAGALIISPQPVTLAIVVAATFVGALVRALLGDRLRASLRNLLPEQNQTFERLAAVALLAVALAVPWVFYGNRYLLDLCIQILTYMMLGWGLNIVVGLAGLLDLGYVAFYAVGAYAYALISQHFGWSFWACLPIAGILAAFWGILLGFPVLPLR